MEYKEYLAIAKKAYKEGSFKPLIRGDEGYALPVSNSAPFDFPTNWDAVIRMCVHRLYQKNNDEKIPEMFRKDIYDLLKGEPFEQWCAFHLCYYLICDERRVTVPFKITDDEFISYVRETISPCKEKLINAKTGCGANFDDGLWYFIWNLAELVKKLFDIDLINEA